MGRAAYFADITNPSFRRAANFRAAGKNTGNEAFVSAISSIIDLDVLPRFWVEEDEPGQIPRHRLPGYDKLSAYDRFVTSDAIWIGQGDRPPSAIQILLDEFPDKPVVPISVGLQVHDYVPDFVLSNEMKTMLLMIQERATIAVRGSYTAEILNRDGVKNVEVIGCPSIYQYPLFNQDFDALLAHRSVKAAAANFKTFFGELSAKDVAILEFFRKNFSAFMEQTELGFCGMYDRIYRDSGDNPTVEIIKSWISRNEVYHFGIIDWIDYLQDFDFSMGSRFHGNIASILAGRRSLFLRCDSRTREMSEFFSLPSLHEDDFNPDIDIQDYFEMADYSVMTSNFGNLIETFRNFLTRNGLSFSRNYEDGLGRFRFS